MTHLDYRLDEHVATITLANPPQNRITEQMVGELSGALDAIAASEARAVLLCAAGEDFSFGGDITTWPDTDAGPLRATFEKYLAVFNRFESVPLPVIAAVQGNCLGGGFELALRADVVFAGRSAHFGHPEQTIAVVTLMGGIYRVAERVGRARAMEWALTSQRLPAEVMAHAGVINHVVADERLAEEARAFAECAANGPTRAHAAHKALLRAWAHGGVGTADQMLFDTAMPLFGSEDTQVGLQSAITALRERKPRPTVAFRGR